MKTLIIPYWYGRFGNNIISLLNAFTLCMQQNFDRILCPKHEFLTDTELIVNANADDQYDDNQMIDPDELFHLKIKNKLLYHMSEKELFDKYIKKYINIDIDSMIEYDMTFYARSEDIFANKIKQYTQPPLYFYKKAAELQELTDKPILVSQDLLNPVSDYLVKHNECIWKQDNLRNDMHILLNSKSLAFGYSTLLIATLLMSKKLKTLYLPTYAYDAFNTKFATDIKDLLTDEQKLVLIDMPNYMKMDEFDHSKDGYQLMLDYTT